jgi:hypothetical protein
MQLKTGCIVVLMIFMQLGVRAQDFGYLGKKNLISIFSTANVRVFPAIQSPIVNFGGDQGYNTVTYNDNNSVNTGTRVFRYDFRASYMRVLTRRLTIGAEFGYEKIKMTHDYQSKLISSPVFKATSYMLTIGTTKKSGLAPVGMSSTFGIGPKIYYFDNTQNYRRSQQDEIEYAMPSYKKNMVGVNFFWQYSYRHLLTNFLVLDVGFRVHTGIVFQNGIILDNGTINSGVDEYDLYDEFQNTEAPQWSKSELKRGLTFENAANLLSLRFGIGFLL